MARCLGAHHVVLQFCAFRSWVLVFCFGHMMHSPVVALHEYMMPREQI